jgi:hypothetical protein
VIVFLGDSQFVNGCHAADAMAKRRIKYLLAAIVGIAIGMTMAQIAVRRMRPALFEEYHRIEEEIYARYLTDGVLPAPSALSTSAQKTLSEHTEIHYTVKDGLRYRYDRPYPARVNLLRLVTLGYYGGGETGCIGESQRPEDLIHNAKLRCKE